MKKIYYLVFTLFSVFYLLTSSIYALPGITVLRWVGSIMLISYSWLTERKFRIHFPYSFAFIVIALIPTLLGVGGESTFYAYERIVSFFLVVFSMLSFLLLEQTTLGTMQNLFEIYTVICGALMLLSLIRDFTFDGRMTGVYMNANFLSCVALFSSVSALAMFHILVNKKRRWIFLLFFFAAALCVIGSGSRMGVICIVLIIYLNTFLSAPAYNLKHIFVQLFKLGIITVILIYILQHFDIVAIDRLFYGGQDISGATGFTRGDAWADVFKIFSEKPLLGWGYASVGYNVFQVVDNTFNWGMHSSYFIILCEMGIIGSLLFLCFFVDYFYKICVRYKALKKKTYIQRCFIKYLFLCCFIMLINAYSESFLFSLGNPMSICFWLPFIMLYCYIYKMRKKRFEVTNE